MKAVVLGLDIATRTGWARVDGEHVRTGVVDCSPRSRGEPEGVRYRRLAEGLESVLEGVAAVILEQPFSKSKRTATVLGGLTAVVLVRLEGLGVEYVFVTASELKAFGAERGAKGKAEMQATACALLGRDLTDDEADAWWLTEYWRARLS